MTLLALFLVLAAAVLHATWNLLAKRASAGGPEFVGLVAVVSTVLYAPFAAGVVVLVRPHIGGAQIAFMSGTAVIHLAYFLMLQGGYRVGDLSVVYPLARGTGPMLATVAAITLLGERPTSLALTGAVLISIGVIALGTWSRGKVPGDGKAVVYALATGVLIATYTLWDKHAVATLAIPPLLYDWAANAGRSVLMTPYGWQRRERVKAVWTAHRLEVIGVGALSPLAYILVLTALVFTPVSYIAPAREVSILIGTMLGARLLAEGHVGRRLVAAAAIVVGLTALALG